MLKGVIEIQTIKEIAEAANVSKTSIYNLIRKHNIPTVKREGKTFLDENGRSLVMAYYSTEQHETISDIITETKEAEDENFQAEFQDDIQDSKPIENSHFISILERELDEKNKTIQALIQSNQSLIQAMTADKINEAARLMIRDMSHSTDNDIKEPPQKESFFKKLFKKK
jgi:AcrR family transcriptional regulator